MRTTWPDARTAGPQQRRLDPPLVDEEAGDEEEGVAGEDGELDG